MAALAVPIARQRGWAAKTRALAASQAFGRTRIGGARCSARRRSAPRPIGSKLAVSESGEMAGSVSGGCVENEVYGSAREVLAGQPPRLLTYGISDDLAFSVGLPCGGEIDVFVQTARPALVERLAEVVGRHERAVLFTVVEGEPLGAQ